MTFPLNSTAELFNYISNLSGVTFDGSPGDDSNIETIEFKLDYKPWIYASSIKSMENDQSLFEIAGKSAKDNFPINILFTKDQVFIYDLETEFIPIYSIDRFLERLFSDYEDLQPFEYRAFNELKSLNYSFTNILIDNLKLKKENRGLKFDKQNLVDELSDTQRKLKSIENSIKTEKLKSQGYAKTILDIAKFTLEKNKLLTKNQIQSLQKHYNINKNEYFNDCSITFYEIDKIISSSYYKIELHMIEGTGVYVNARNKTFVYFDGNGNELSKYENKSDVLFELPWPALSVILEIPNPVQNFEDLFNLG